MASIRVNLVSNLIVKVWTAGITILLIPLYIRYLGIESYGLVGFYGTLIGSMSILDLGLSLTLSRELAKHKYNNHSVEDIRNLTFSLECIYWIVGVLLALIIIGASGFIANHWVQTEDLPVSAVRQTIMLMGLVVAFQWPISLYDGGLRGLDEQLLGNSISLVMLTLRGAGVIIVLKYFSATLQAFFLWQAGISFLYVLVMRWGLWKKMPLSSTRTRFSVEQLRIIWRFAAGVTGIGAITLFLAQVDKILLSKILPLSQFGYYTLAFTIATSITLIVGPISQAFFPRLTGLVAAGNRDELIQLYHKACRLMASFIFPVAFVLVFFIKDILWIWTKNGNTTENTYQLAQVLIIGSMFNAIMVLPYNLIIAHGWTKFSFYQNLIAVIILLPMLFVWTNLYGAIGATFVWLSVNTGYIFISQPLMHRKLLKGELGKWYLNDTLLPMLPSLFVILAIKLALSWLWPSFQLNLLAIICILIITFFISILYMPDTLAMVKNLFKRNPKWKIS